MEIKLLSQKNPIGYEIAHDLNSGNYKRFMMTIAYAKNSGIGRLYEDIRKFSNNGGITEAIIGIDQGITSYQSLVNISSLTKELYIHHDKGPVSFHAKVYLLGNERVEKIIVGSSNLTGSGLYLNFEANIGLLLDDSPVCCHFRDEIEEYWNHLLSNPNTLKADKSFIDNLLQQGLISDETAVKPFKDIVSAIAQTPFGVGDAPPLPPQNPEISSDSPVSSIVFAMQLSGFDVSPRSQDPVILIPLRALRQLPTFWDWPYNYTLSAAGYPEIYLPSTIIIDGTTISNFTLRIYYYEGKAEFRLQCEPIKRNGNQGDILLIEKPLPTSRHFNIKLIRKGTTEHSRIEPQLLTRVSQIKSYSYL